MATMVQNILVQPFIANEDLFSEETYYSGKTKKTRIEFDLNKIDPTPSELGASHSPVNEIRILYYLTDKLSCNAGNVEKYIKENKDVSTIITSLLSKRAEIGQLYDIAEDFTRSMSTRKMQQLYDAGEKLTKYLIEYECIDRSEWQLKNWGCAKNASSTKIPGPESPYKEIISFLTPDYPPTKAIKKLADRFCNEEGENLRHVWYPVDFSASKLVGAGRTIYRMKNGCLIEKTEEYNQAKLYELYFRFKDNMPSDHKASAFNYEQYDRLYLRLPIDLREKFNSLCKLEKISMAQAIQALAHKTVDEKAIPFDRTLATKENIKYTGKMTTTSLKMPILLRREFDIVVRDTGSTVNKIANEYMMLCLDAMTILFKEETPS